MQKRTPQSTITVPVPLHKELRVGTLLSVIRRSGLPRKLFENIETVCMSADTVCVYANR